MELIKLPVLRRTKQYTCGQWSFVYPPFKGDKTMYTDTDGELQSFSVNDLINHYKEKTYTVSETITFNTQIKALSKEQAIGKFIDQIGEAFPDSSVFKEISKGIKIKEIKP